MTFVEGRFVGFMALFCLLWWATRGHYRSRLGVMLAMSLVFYGYHHKWFVPIILAYCLVDWGVALLIERGFHRKRMLLLGIGLNLTALSVWKYAPLVTETLSTMAGWPAREVALGMQESWIAPMGISFYAFIGISYMVDVYRGEIPAERNFWRYALFASFFPHLVAGPILRAKEFLSHLGPGELPTRSTSSLEATFLIGRGLFKKLVLADTIALTIDPFFAEIASPATVGVWSLPYVYLYAFQIYFDFSGYTDMGRGLGLWFGFRWPENFNWPYLATSVQDFWRRWHMTLSRFLRDYLFIPLGGSRNGLVRAIFTTMVTMLLGGLWHGASWSFMVWGGLHGLFLVVHRLWGQTSVSKQLAQATGALRWLWTTAAVLITFHAICVTWCFFRLTKLSESLECLHKAVAFDPAKMFVGGSDDVSVWLILLAYGTVICSGTAAGWGSSLPALTQQLAQRPFLQGVAWGGSVSLILAAAALAHKGKSVPFIYFQF